MVWYLSCKILVLVVKQCKMCLKLDSQANPGLSGNFNMHCMCWETGEIAVK